MPWGLHRYQQARDLHFIPFSCYRRQPLLDSAEAKRLFESALEQTRRHYGFWATGYVVMPEHVHLPGEGRRKWSYLWRRAGKSPPKQTRLGRGTLMMVGWAPGQLCL